ncbi:MAG TPA: DUF2341 domain-containing protein [Conexivisphaerales archaeon]|nr:DUF2341 domain-containing protein [Conexivisphaerales archaeon]
MPRTADQIPQATLQSPILPFLSEATYLEKADPNQTVFIGLCPSLDIKSAEEAVSSGRRFSLEAFRASFGPSDHELESIVSYVSNAGLGQIAEISWNRIKVQTTIGNIENVLGIPMNVYQLDGVTFYATPQIPVLSAQLSGSVYAILGLNNYSLVTEHTQSVNGTTAIIPADIYSYYDLYPMFQSGVNASGVSIGIPGNPNAGVNESDIQYFWSNNSIPASTINLVTLGGFGPPPEDYRYSGEPTLDIEWAGTTGPGANITLVTSNTAGDPYGQVYDEYSYLVNTIRPAVLSCSIGPNLPTDNGWISAYHTLMTWAAGNGTTVVAASGDNGSLSIAIPADDPFVTAVGGVSNGLNSSTPGIISQTGWNLSGGGFVNYSSGQFFPKPSYQSQEVVTAGNDSYRDVPDIALPSQSVAMYMDMGVYPFTGFVYGDGTSFSAPMFAGIMADAVAYSGHLFGCINPDLYQLGYSSDLWYRGFNDVTSGNNGNYSAQVGWDYVTGIGTPDAWNLVKDLKYVVNFTEMGLPPSTIWNVSIGTQGGLTGWGYYKTHVINSASGAGSGYQVNLTLHFGTGTDSPYDVYLNGRTRTDFGDVRFTAADGTTLLPYWIERSNAGDSAKVWIRISADISSSLTTIYLYYGNPSATSISNGKDTFLVFDDFNSGSSLNSTIWTVGAGSWSVSSGRATGSNSGNIIFYSQNSYQDARIRLNGTCNSGADDLDLLGRYQDSSNWYDLYTTYYYTSNNIYVEKQIGGSFSFISSAASRNLGSRGTFHISDFEVAGSHLQGLVDDVATTLVSASDTSISGSGRWGVRGWSAGSVSIDWILISKYVQNEPTQGSWSSEVHVTAVEQLSSSLGSIVFFNVSSGSTDWSAVSEVNASYGVRYSAYSPSGNINVPSVMAVSISYYPEYLLMENVNPDGAGNITPGSGWYVPAEWVTITATDGPYYYFTDWSGSGNGSYTGNSPSWSVQMNGPINETADFQKKVYLNLTVYPSGGGFTSPGNSWFTPGTNLTISVTANSPYYDFRYWTGSAYNGNSTSWNITINSNVTETATFYVQLAMAAYPSAGGTVTPGTGYYYLGSTVTINATDYSWYQFNSWTGGSYSGPDRTHTFNLSAPATETANFYPYLSLSVSPAGGGTVNVSSGYKPYNSYIPVRANPSSNYNFDHWLGSFSNATQDTITINMAWPVNETAYFSPKQQQYYLTMRTGGSGHGTVSPSSGWYNASTVVPISATPDPGCYSFQNWAGSGNGSYTGTNNPWNVTMYSNITETGRFINGCRPIGGAVTPTTMMSDLLDIQLLLPLLFVITMKGTELVPRIRLPNQRGLV